MLSLPRSPLAADAPAELVPEPIFAPWVTIGWLRDGLAAGRIPKPPQNSYGVDAARKNLLRLSLRQTSPSKDAFACSSPTKGEIRNLEAGGHVSLGPGSFAYVQLVTEDGWTPRVLYGQPFLTGYDLNGMTLTATWVPLTIRISPVPGKDLWLCG